MSLRNDCKTVGWRFCLHSTDGAGFIRGREGRVCADGTHPATAIMSRQKPLRGSVVVARTDATSARRCPKDVYLLQRYVRILLVDSPSSREPRSENNNYRAD